VSKDRAAPFSRKHKRYWIPVTGGMVLIGAINVGLGVCTYERAGDPEPIHVELATDAGPPPPSVLMTRSEIPAAVMRAFAVKYPRTIPVGANLDKGNFVIVFPVGAEKKYATFQADGTFVSDVAAAP